VPVLIVFAALCGAVCGVFVPRVVYRLAVAPGEGPRAECPEGHVLAGGAVRGWFGAARCVAGDGCARFGPARRWPVALTAVVCGLMAAAVGPRPELVVWLLIVPGCVVLGWVDGIVHRLPDVVTLPSATAAVTLLGVVAALPGHHGSWATAVLGAVALSGFYFVLFLIRSGVGFGDVKLALVVGTVLGWYGWLVLFAGTFIAFFLGALYGVTLVAAGRADRKSRVPFGPTMLLGMLAGLMLGGLHVL
jgi:leader peptidase (prepilin peptidase)/N-methyltransferase